jgi:pimeloyl-ACP methyl ester carboxylesterase
MTDVNAAPATNLAGMADPMTTSPADRRPAADDLTISDRPSAADGPSMSRGRTPIIDGRPVRKDEIELPERGLYVESWLPERRSRRKPLLFVHGELGGSWLWERYLGYFAGRGWEGHALNLRNHFWSQSAPAAELDFDSYLEDVVAVMARLGPNVVVLGHGMGGLLGLKALERMPAAALILLSSELPSDLRSPARAHELRDVPDVYGKAIIGWETLPARLQRDHRDLSLADVLRIQHLLGQKPFESGAARRQIRQGIPVDRGPLNGLPKLVIGGGLDVYVPEPVSAELAGWLDAQYEPFAAHSHYGLVLAETGFQQVADVIRAFLETHRL